MDAAVIGIKTYAFIHLHIRDLAHIVSRATGDEQPRAYVVRKPKSSLSEKEVVDFVRTRVSTIKHLTGGVAFLDAIPKNPVSLGDACRIFCQDVANNPISQARY